MILRVTILEPTQEKDADSGKNLKIRVLKFFE